MNKNQKGFSVVEVVIIILVLGVIGFFASHIFFKKALDVAYQQQTPKMTKLQSAANQKQAALNQLTILSDQPTSSKAVVDGDALTANPNPDISTFAQASFKTNSPLNILESQVSINLNKASFIRQGTSDAPYYKVYNLYGNSPFDVRSSAVEFKYLNGNRAILIDYIFDKAYSCPGGYVCERNEKNINDKNIYTVQGFGTYTVVRMVVYYASLNNYKVQIL